MGSLYKRYLIKSAVIALFLSILASLLIFHLYHSRTIKKETEQLGVEEDDIIARSGNDKEKFRFCSHPPFDFGTRISWVKFAGHSDSECLKMSFKDNKTYYLGIHLYLTLVFKPYLEGGVLEFWLKGKEDYPLANNLDLRLKEGTAFKRMAGISLSTGVSKDWQKISLPLNKLALIKESNEGFENEDREFSWEIQEFLFSLTPIAPGESVELFIDDLKMADGQKIIYEIF